MFNQIHSQSSEPVSTLPVDSAAGHGGLSASPLADKDRIEPPLKGEVFPTPFVAADYGVGIKPYTLVEQQLMRALAAVKEKPQWWLKAADTLILEKWRNELAEAFEAYLKEPRDYTFEGIRYDVDDTDGRRAVAKQWSDAVIEEIQSLSELVIVEHGENGPRSFVPASVDGTWLSDDAVSPALKARLVELIKPLENPVDLLTGAPRSRDYHPGSDQQVIDLVHPSLYPLVYGKSLIVPVEGKETIYSWKKTIGTGVEILQTREKADSPKYSWMKKAEFHSDKFQWLPSEIEVKAVTDAEGCTTQRKARFRSYINNLHPEVHTELYRVLEDIFAEAFIPLFNKVLRDMTFLNGRQPRQVVSMNEGDLYGECPVDENEAGDDFDELYQQWYEDRRPKVPVGVQAWSDRLPPRSFDLCGSPEKPTRLQVIVKLATIELTPEKPSYGGGSWHVEGMLNESIVASGIYYISSENVRSEPSQNSPTDLCEPTRLAFRTSVCEPPYEQNDDKGVKAVYGLANDEPLIQPLGSVATTEGRCLAWPNTLQHQVQPFTLVDRAKAGYRKVLVFFLVDPSKRIVSTSDIPPQQEEWILKELLAKKRPRETSSEDGADDSLSRTVIGNRDVLGEVLKFSWHFSHADALSLREELMAERKHFVDETMKETYEREFSLCEH